MDFYEIPLTNWMKSFKSVLYSFTSHADEHIVVEKKWYPLKKQNRIFAFFNSFRNGLHMFKTMSFYNFFFFA